MLIDVAISGDKCDQDGCQETSIVGRIRYVNTKVTPVKTEATGTVSKTFRKYRNNIRYRERIK
jgi:hypothetical protein